MSVHNLPTSAEQSLKRESDTLPFSKYTAPNNQSVKSSKANCSGLTLQTIIYNPSSPPFIAKYVAAPATRAFASVTLIPTMSSDLPPPVEYTKPPPPPAVTLVATECDIVRLEASAAMAAGQVMWRRYRR